MHFLDLATLGLPGSESVDPRDQLTGATFTWGTGNYVRLSPGTTAHVLHVQNAF